MELLHARPTPASARGSMPRPARPPDGASILARTARRFGLFELLDEAVSMKFRDRGASGDAYQGIGDKNLLTAVPYCAQCAEQTKFRFGSA